jgi:hypothetical protein
MECRVGDSTPFARVAVHCTQSWASTYLMDWDSNKVVWVLLSSAGED